MTIHQYYQYAVMKTRLFDGTKLSRRRVDPSIAYFLRAQKNCLCHKLVTTKSLEDQICGITTYSWWVSNWICMPEKSAPLIRTAASSVVKNSIFFPVAAFIIHKLFYVKSMKRNCDNRQEIYTKHMNCRYH